MFETSFVQSWVFLCSAQAITAIPSGFPSQVVVEHGVLCRVVCGLCVYSAVHLNVFRRNCGWWARGFIKCKWLVVALLAPEFIVFNAWSQRRQAVRIARMLRRLNGQEEPSYSIRTGWAHFWPRAGMFDLENPKRQEKQRGGHASEP